MAKLDKYFFGVSIIFNILFFELILTTPYCEGLLTGWINIFAPDFSFVQYFNFSVKFWP